MAYDTPPNIYFTKIRVATTISVVEVSGLILLTGEVPSFCFPLAESSYKRRACASVYDYEPMHSFPWREGYNIIIIRINSILPVIHLLIVCTYHLGVVVCVYSCGRCMSHRRSRPEGMHGSYIVPRRLGLELRTLFTKKTAGVVEPNRTYSNPLRTAPTFWEYILGTSEQRREQSVE